MTSLFFLSLISEFILPTYLSSTFNPSASLSRPMCIVSGHEIIASFVLVNKQASSVNCLKATTPNLRGKSLLVTAQVDRFTVEPANKIGGYPSRYLHMRACKGCTTSHGQVKKQPIQATSI